MGTTDAEEPFEVEEGDWATLLKTTTMRMMSLMCTCTKKSKGYLIICTF